MTTYATSEELYLATYDAAVTFLPIYQIYKKYTLRELSFA